MSKRPRGPSDPLKANAATPVGYPISLSDIGNAERLVRHFGRALRHVGAWSRWLYFDGKCWVEDDTGEITRCAKQVALRIKNEESLHADPELLPLSSSEWAPTTIESPSRATDDPNLSP